MRGRDIRAALWRRGLGSHADPEEADPLLRDQPLLAELCAASVQGRVAIGPHAGNWLKQVKMKMPPSRPLLAALLSLLPNGRLLYRLRHRCRNGATHVVFEPLEFAAKLAALVSRPMFNLVRHHEALSPAARWISSIVPSINRSVFQLFVQGA